VVSYLTSNGKAPAESGETPVALLPKASVVDVVFDTADVFIAAIEAPRLSDPKLRQALPNLLEDRLLTSPADCHFAFARPTGGATTLAQPPRLAVAVLDRGVLTRALDALNAAGLRPQRAYGEVYTLPAPHAGVLSVRVARGRGRARSGPHDGFAFDLDTAEPPAALLLAVRQLGIKRVQAYGREADRLAALAPALGTEVEVVGHAVDFEAIEGAVNLLQGPFASGGLLSRAGLPRLSAGALRAPLGWAAAAALVFIGGMNAYWFKLDSEARALRGGMETAFRSAFPEATAVVDPVLQTKRQLGGLRSRAGIPSAEDFSVLNTQAAQLLAGAPVGSISGMDYRDGSLRIKFKPGQAPDAGLQNTLRAQAIQQGLALRFDADGAARLSPAGQ
jgi:general secretion pathway protein L